MKTAAICFSLIFSFSALADIICYKSNSPAVLIPNQICIDEATMDIDTGKLFITTGNRDIPQILSSDMLTRRNEDGYNFKASVLLKNIWEPGCGAGLVSKLIIEGENDNYGYVDPNYLTIRVSYRMTNETCHSVPTFGVVEYTRD